jgi:hypothetical protein
MKQNTKFFKGLGLGMLFGFLVFSSVNLMSSNTNPDFNEVNEINQSNSTVKGEWINAEATKQRISGYSSTKNIGGFIGKKYLRDVVGIMGDGYIKYRFYKVPGSEDNEIGIIFYPEENCNNMLSTGSGSFCPVLCEYPED